MNSEKVISISEYVELLKKVTGKTIWKVAHPADGMLIIDLGRKLQRNGFDEGEITMHIIGPWSYEQNDLEIQHSEAEESESRSDFFNRMDILEKNFPFSQFESVSLEKDTILFKGDNDKVFNIRPNSDGEYLDIRIVHSDTDFESVSFDPDQKTYVLTISSLEK